VRPCYDLVTDGAARGVAGETGGTLLIRPRQEMQGPSVLSEETGVNGYGVCRSGDHRAPQSGGTCPCGMVTRIPARQPAAASPPLGVDVLALLERCLRDGPGVLDAESSGLLRERATQLLAALDLAGSLPLPGETAQTAA
jgi:hypothetical protein